MLVALALAVLAAPALRYAPLPVMQLDVDVERTNASLGPAFSVGPAYPASSPFMQVGSIMADAGAQGRQILPLFGRPVPHRRGRWNYYTQTDTFNPVQVSVSNNCRDCMAEMGCEELFGGESISVGAYGPYPFAVSLHQR